MAINLFNSFLFRYGSPLIFKPPETSIHSKRRAAVDGSKYDLYTLGLLALDMFTEMSFSKGVSQQDFTSCKTKYWSKIIYPCLFRLLQVRKKLTNLLQISPTLILKFKHFNFCYSIYRFILKQLSNNVYHA